MDGTYRGMTWSRTALLFALVLVASTHGEDVTLKVRHAEVDLHFRCVLPTDLRVKVERQGKQVLAEFDLQKSDVIPINSQVKIAKRDTEGVIRLHHHRIHDAKLLSTQAYHNSAVGAAFVVSCVQAASAGRMYFRMEGSVYLNGQKFRLRPVPAAVDSVANTQFDPQGVAVIYSMNPMWEHIQYEAAEIEPQPQPVSNIPDLGVSGTGISDLDGRRFPPLHRYRRATKVYYVDVLPVVDYSLYRRWLDLYGENTDARSQLNSYLTNIMTAIDMRLKTLAVEDTTLNLRMVTPVISETPEASPYTESIKFNHSGDTRVSAPTLLDTFNTWVNQQTTLPRHDHAMLFTSYDMIPSNDPNEVLTNITKGLANTAALCHQGSISLVEDKGAYQSENVAAHELGHGLGSRHDGEGNACTGTDRYLMASGTFPQTVDNLLHPWVFSSCSSDAIAAYMSVLEGEESSLNDCLLRQEGERVDSVLTITAQAVCERYYGPTAFPCRDFQQFSEICAVLRCRTIESRECILVTPPTGTCCGNNQKCTAGVCGAAATEGECSVNETCPLGDQPSISLGNTATTCPQLNPAFCYDSAARRECCTTCRSHRTGDPDCPYGDRANCSAVTDANRCTSDAVVATECCGTCAKLLSQPPTVPPTVPPSLAPEPTTDPGQVPSNSTNPDTLDEDKNQYGFKPEGFHGCYLPPCASGRIYSSGSVLSLMLACLWLIGFLIRL